MTRMAESSLGEREDLCGPYREHQDALINILVMKTTFTYLPLPSAIPLLGPCLGETLEYLGVRDSESFTLDDDV